MFYVGFRLLEKSGRCVVAGAEAPPVVNGAQANKFSKGFSKDGQGVMRHSRTATTTDVYMQEIPASVQSAINFINFGVAKVESGKPENTEQFGYNRCHRQQSAQAFCARDTK